ncbi:hypothetical protein HOU45_gp61 [Microbacterium phage Armstrong]|uniref:Uncharacterized protein n=1 Tax=Microbacterium phage Armstrong TaxID=2419971 RepID=A0A3G2KD54_9CAUD|nr:hypothetical protein HOU45_gp61 [Microbacterium phage Armstrong]AYN56946.1 hypothetical protein PBI_ARMSTRONG_61 [Microbacterium phage Armstrong]
MVLATAATAASAVTLAFVVLVVLVPVAFIAAIFIVVALRLSKRRRIKKAAETLAAKNAATDAAIARLKVQQAEDDIIARSRQLIP